jgi:hypothetical protein
MKLITTWHTTVRMHGDFLLSPEYDKQPARHVHEALMMTAIKSPPYIAYALKRDGRTGRWVEVGIATVHKDGKGFDVMLDRLPVAGFSGHVSVRAAEAKPIEPFDSTVGGVADN